MDTHSGSHGRTAGENVQVLVRCRYVPTGGCNLGFGEGDRAVGP
jgi:hypothetical protein